MDRKAKKLAIKKKRLPLLDRQTELHKMNCNRCAAETCIDCPISNELLDIGRKLLNISEEAFEPPTELTWSTYLLLKERDWNDNRISAHYGIYIGGLHEFVKLNKNPKLYLKEEKKMVAQQKEQCIELTVERYLELKKEKKSDYKIRKQFGLQPHDLNKFKNKHGLVKKKEEGKSQAEAPIIKINVPEIKAEDIARVLAETEPVSPKENPLSELVDKLRAKLNDMNYEKELITEKNKELTNSCNEHYQNYVVAKSGLKEYVDKLNTLKEEHSKEIQHMNSLLEDSYKADAYLTDTLELLVIARKTNRDLSN